jgi:hypothetical protein
LRKVGKRSLEKSRFFVGRNKKRDYGGTEPTTEQIVTAAMIVDCGANPGRYIFLAISPGKLSDDFRTVPD